MTVIYELHPCYVEIHRTSENELPIRQGFRKLSSDRETDLHTDKQTNRQTDRQPRNYIPRRFADQQKVFLVCFVTKTETVRHFHFHFHIADAGTIADWVDCDQIMVQYFKLA